MAEPQGRPHPPYSLTTAPIGATLTRMTIPTVFGIVAILMFNLVDTYFIGLIGAKELAAVSFTFPVSFVVMNISMGIGIGTAATLSTKIGAGKHAEAKAINTHAVMLAVIFASPIAVLGIATIEPLFKLLGAQADTIDLIREYMSIWYAGIPLLYLPMIGNAAIRATGDTKTPSIIMAIAGLANGILDPLLIFGLGPFPELGIKGAGIATVASWFFACCAVLWVLGKKNHLLGKAITDHPVLKSWIPILKVGMPAGATNFLPPLGAAFLIRLIAEFGEPAVAGYGVGTRIESIALVVIMALSSSITPFVGQNFGAKHYHRIRDGLKAALFFTVTCELAITLILMITAPWLAGVFNDDPEVISAITLFLWCLPISYGCHGMVMLICATLNALHKPLYGTAITLSRLFLLTLPLAFLGGYFHSLMGVFVGMAIANVVAGITVLLWFSSRFQALTGQT